MPSSVCRFSASFQETRPTRQFSIEISEITKILRFRRTQKEREKPVYLQSHFLTSFYSSSFLLFLFLIPNYRTCLADWHRVTYASFSLLPFHFLNPENPTNHNNHYLILGVNFFHFNPAILLQKLNENLIFTFNNLSKFITI